MTLDVSIAYAISFFGMLAFAATCYVAGLAFARRLLQGGWDHELVAVAVAGLCATTALTVIGAALWLVVVGS